MLALLKNRKFKVTKINYNFSTIFYEYVHVEFKEETVYITKLNYEELLTKTEKTLKVNRNNKKLQLFYKKIMYNL